MKHVPPKPIPEEPGQEAEEGKLRKHCFEVRSNSQNAGLLCGGRM